MICGAGLEAWEALSPRMAAGEHLRLVEAALLQSQGRPVFPEREKIFRALQLTPPSAVRVVIVGQDPYFNEYQDLGCQADGLAFSVGQGFPLPPSLRNIFKELQSSFPKKRVNCTGELSRWARQGVLLLNSVLTVEKGVPGSHGNLGWEALTDELIALVSQQRDGVVFLLWGGAAQKKQTLIDPVRHTVLTTSHPSPLSAWRGFLGSDIFAACNRALVARGDQPVNWTD